MIWGVELGSTEARHSPGTMGFDRIQQVLYANPILSPICFIVANYPAKLYPDCTCFLDFFFGNPLQMTLGKEV